LTDTGGSFTFRPIEEADKVNKFSIAKENDGLRAFLKKAAWKFHASNIAKTYVAVEAGDSSARVRSYVTILLSEIKKEYAKIEDCPEAERYNYPAVKIGRLATDRDYEGKGLASTLIELITGLTRYHVMPHAGCRFLMLDANREKIDFYKRRGFALVDNKENLESQNPVMFINLHQI
jgi:GNAT superfamily N-acetyltransferase